MSQSRLPLALLLLALLSACGDEKKFDPNLATAVDTFVQFSAIEAGTRTPVACVRSNGKGQQIAGGTFTLSVSPAEGASVNGLEAGSTRAGVLAVSCRDEALGLTDESPAEVTVNPAAATHTVITVSPSTVAAGEPADVTCVARDPYGNTAAANLRLEVTPKESVTVDGLTAVSATAAGTYEVLCFAATVDEAQRGRTNLTVTPGPRVGIALDVAPDQLAYRLFQPITVTAVGVDSYGNRIAGDIAIDGLDATPTGHHRVIGDALNQVRFDLEGKYTLSAKAKDDASQTATTPVVVDQTPPELTVTSPERGLVTDTLTEVTVNGKVTDNLGELGEFTIGDRPVAVDADGTFSAKVPLKHALTLIDVHAEDPYGNASTVTRAAERSNGYYALTGRTFETDGVGDAVALVLTQEAVDDGDHDEANRDDLAHIFEFVLANIDFLSFIPRPLTTFGCIGGSCEIAMTDVSIPDVNVDIDLANGKLQMKVELVGLSGTISLFFPCDNFLCPTRPMVELPGTVATDRVVLTTDILVNIDAAGVTTTRAQNTVVDIQGLVVDINDPTGIAQAAVDLVVTYIRDPLVMAVELVITALIEDQLANALDGLFSALNLNQSFDLPSPIPNQPPNTLIIATRPTGVDISPERLQLRVDGLARAKTPKRPRTHLGSLKHTGCAPASSLTFPSPAPIVVGLHDDLINQLLFAVWEGGTLSLDLSGPAANALVGNFGLLDATIQVDALLPPVLDSCQRANTAQLGDLYIEAEALFAGDPIHLGLWISAEAPVDVDISPNDEGALQAKLVLGTFDPMWIEVVINEGAFADDDETVVSLIRDTLIPQLLGMVGDAASFTLPTIDLGALTTAVPAGTVINLDVRDVTRDNAYLTVQGALK
jgi:hypothetical protein